MELDERRLARERAAALTARNQQARRTNRAYGALDVIEWSEAITTNAKLNPFPGRRRIHPLPEAKAVEDEQ